LLWFGLTEEVKIVCFLNLLFRTTFQP